MHLHLYGIPLNFVELFRYLRVTVFGDFRWGNHINNVASKACKSLGMVKRVLHKAPRNVEKLAYMTLYRPVKGVFMRGMGSLSG